MKPSFGALFLVVCSGFISSPSSASGKYPSTFEWGAAFSAHQTEGKTGGGEYGDWYRLEHPPAGQKPVVAHGDTADVATDFWNRYEEDLRLAKKFGLTTVRTSIAWEKIEPRPGQFNRKAIEHYRAVLKEMHAQGLRPMIALHHFTHPMWFHEKGHWLSPDSPKYFLRYARYVVENLRDLCDLWITFNEPMIQVMMGYVSGENPPRIKSANQGFEAGVNLARAHRMVTAMIHEVQGESPDARGRDGRLRGVGLANSWQLYEPKHKWNPMDRVAAKFVAESMNWAFMRGVESGVLKIKLPILGVPLRKRRLPESDLDGIKGSPHVDWIGINYYSCYQIAFNPFNLSSSWSTPPGVPQGDNGWAICPDGLETIIRQSAKEFPGYPLVVSENGLSDGADSRRPQFIRDHLQALDRAMFESVDGTPVDLRGYYHWSLTDNFEWLLGYQHRFGLVEIRYDNDLKRVPRKSARVYSEEIARRKPR